MSLKEILNFKLGHEERTPKMLHLLHQIAPMSKGAGKGTCKLRFRIFIIQCGNVKVVRFLHSIWSTGDWYALMHHPN